MSALVARLRACLDPAAFPYERGVSQGALLLRLAHVVPCVIVAWFVLHELPALAASLAPWAPLRIPCAAAGAVVLAVDLLIAARVGTFLWADGDAFGWPINELAFRELMAFTGINTNLWSTCTEEGSNAQHRSERRDPAAVAEDDANQRLFDAGKFVVHLPWEQSGQPRYDYQLTMPETWSRAQRLHMRVVRPWLRRRGVPGY